MRPISKMRKERTDRPLRVAPWIPTYFAVALVYGLLGYGLIQFSSYARIGTIMVLPYQS